MSSDKKMTKKLVISILVIIGVATLVSSGLILWLPQVLDFLGPVPEFVENDWIELNKIANISKYRSTIGHGYISADTSNKHYFQPYSCFAGTNDNVSVFAPVDLSVTKVRWESNGINLSHIVTVDLKSNEHPSIAFVFFHLNIETSNLEVGQTLQAGQFLGYCDFANHGSTDIAILRQPFFGATLSWFQLLTPDLMATYENRGVTREKAIKTDAQVAESEANGYSFSNSDPNDWITLNGTNPCP